jgi:sterol 3beta-glucosyltransferase
MKIVILALGKRGDVQPLVALGQGLTSGGYNVLFATNPDYESLVRQYGLEFAPLRADPEGVEQTEMGRAVLEGNAISTMRITRADVMPMMRRVLDGCWNAVQEARAIIYNPAVLAGYHLVEKLEVPGFIASPLPAVTPTAAFPNPASGIPDLGGFLNKLSYSLSRADTPYRRTISKWRDDTLCLKPRGRLADNLTLNGRAIPVLYCYSPNVVPFPKTWPPATFVTGYWFLGKPRGWEPPAELVRFIEGGLIPVYIGFPGVKFDDPKAVLSTIVGALAKSGQRGVVSIDIDENQKPRLPDYVYLAREIPHTWLFPRVDAVVHHGGAGTTGVSLAAGKVTVTCPCESDQFFWSRVVEDLGVGPKALPFKKLSKDGLSRALLVAITDEKMKHRAASIGESIRAENGIRRAMQVINSEMISWQFPVLINR